MNQEENDDNTSIAIKIVMIVSLLLISMDILEIYLSYTNLEMSARKFDAEVFENCIKYHIISQMTFTLFALFAALSAFFLSFLLLLENEVFMLKLYRTFMHFNHMVFGPYLLTATILGFVYFNEICFNCDPKDLSRRYLNASTLMSLILCFLISSLISVVFSFCNAVKKILLSIRFRPGGWRFLGRYFWNHVRNQNTNEVVNDNRNNVNQPVQRNPPVVGVEYVEIRELRPNEIHTQENNRGPNEERRRRANENIRKLISEEEKKDNSRRRIAFNKYTVEKFDDSGSYEDLDSEDRKNEDENKSSDNQ
jgi:hypothetical protein